MLLPGIVACACNPATRRLGLGDRLRTRALPGAAQDGTEQPGRYGGTQPRFSGQARPDQICDLLEVSSKTCTNLFIVEGRRLNWLPPPGLPGEEGVWI